MNLLRRFGRRRACLGGANDFALAAASPLFVPTGLVPVERMIQGPSHSLHRREVGGGGIDSGRDSSAESFHRPAQGRWGQLNKLICIAILGLFPCVVTPADENKAAKTGVAGTFEDEQLEVNKQQRVYRLVEFKVTALMSRRITWRLLGKASLAVLQELFGSLVARGDSGVRIEAADENQGRQR